MGEVYNEDKSSGVPCIIDIVWLELFEKKISFLMTVDENTRSKSCFRYPAFFEADFVLNVRG